MDQQPHLFERLLAELAEFRQYVFYLGESPVVRHAPPAFG